MNEHTLEISDFPRLLEALKTLAFTPGGKAYVNSMLPDNRLENVKKLQDETTQAKVFLTTAGMIPIAEAKPIKAIVADCSIGSVITAKNGYDVYLTLKASREIKAIVDTHREIAPTIAEIADRISQKSKLERLISKSIDEDGEVMDSASDRLTSIRSQMRMVKVRVKEKLDEIIKTSSYSKMIQEPVIKIRDDRYVIPLKSEFRNHFPCIVHDSSSSGQTLYVEPLSVIPLNNDLRNLRQRGREEIERILTEITKEIAYESDDLINIHESISKLDFIFAKGQLSTEWNCNAPELDSGARVKIVSGRHPFLSVDPVPIDIQLGEGYRTLILTGPNTGGKTVTLKTVSLFVIMTQCGLHLPSSPATKIGMYDNVLVDIGDEQSISQNLSTFSSHMSNIVSIIMQAKKCTLVLIDELGSGTDPSEGAVIGYSIIKHLYDNSIPTIITTHIGELKTFGYKHSHAMNASVGFDSDTLNPTYKINIGTPGSSHAFDICKRLGLPESILSYAKELTGDSDKNVNEIINQMNRDAKSIEEDRESSKKARFEVERLRDKHLKEYEDFESNKKNLLDKELKKASKFLSAKMVEADNIVKQLAKATRQSKETDDLKKRLDSIQESINEERSFESFGNGEIPDINDLEPGDAVYVPKFKSQGIIMEIIKDKDKVLVQVGSARIQMFTNKVERISPKKTKNDEEQTEKRPAFSNIPIKLELYGLPTSDALIKLDRYLDSAYGAGLPFVYVVHGRGTGALRKAITEFLPSSPRVDRFHLADESEGGNAVTIVFLK
jgi:DNA mismatch repair protein MutS2